MTHDLVRWVQSAAQLEEQLQNSNGELTEGLEQWLAAVDVRLPAAVDNAKFLMDRLDTVEAEWRARAMESTKVARGIAEVRERLKTRVKTVLQEMPEQSIEGNRYRLQLANAKPKLIIDEKLVTNDYKTPVVEMVPDKELIRRTLELGDDVQGASLQENFQLRSYAIKK